MTHAPAAFLELDPTHTAAESKRSDTGALVTWPTRIFLQHGDDGDDVPRFIGGMDICWCEDKISTSDVEYVRADLAA